uniref:Glycoprotein Q1 n=1 Tax=Human betaherpesvirus 6 TaxID=10368 RepID=A0A5P9VJ96_9BETA|nr:U97 [Human betaherpesvirus 6]QFX45560.1 glycoprotein Q1 [Human betaherpesvirus 6]
MWFFLICSTIFVQTGTSKQRFRNAGLLMVNNIFTVQGRYTTQNMFERKEYVYKHLGQALCQGGHVFYNPKEVKSENIKMINIKPTVVRT